MAEGATHALVRSSENEQSLVAARSDAVHLNEELRFQASRGLVLVTAADTQQRIDLERSDLNECICV